MLTILRRNQMIELPEDDPRVALIDLLLFGPEQPQQQPIAPAPPPSPGPTPWELFWKELKPPARRWLALLSEGPVPRSYVARIRELRQTGLLKVHQHIAAVGRRTGVPFFIVAKGRDAKRRWTIPSHYVDPIKESIARN